jgi:hypothetical protein
MNEHMIIQRSEFFTGDKRLKNWLIALPAKNTYIHDSYHQIVGNRNVIAP